MAKMTNLGKFEFDPHGNPDKFHTVGHNRTVRHYISPIENKLRVACYLHGNNIVTFDRLSDNRVEVYLSTCGYMTQTTRRAMNDFLSAFGLKARVSFAGGKMSVRYTDGPMRDRRTDQNQLGTLLFTIERNNKVAA